MEMLSYSVFWNTSNEPVVKQEEEPDLVLRQADEMFRKSIYPIKVKRKNEERYEKLQKLKKVKVVDKIREMKIINIEDVNKTQQEMYKERLRELGKDPKEVIGRKPPKTNVQILSYVKKYGQGDIFYIKMMNHNVVGSSIDNVKHPKLPPLSRVYIKEFLREPNEGDFERPCINLCRNPYVGESGFMCESYRISARDLGEKNAFKARELWFPHQESKIKSAIQLKNNPADHLPEKPGWCYLCHLLFVANKYLEDKNKKLEKEQVDHAKHKPDTSNNDKIFAWKNQFTIETDKFGEYKSRFLWPVDGEQICVYGKFIKYDSKLYKVIEKQGIKTIIESDELVFRLSRVSQIGSGGSTP